LKKKRKKRVRRIGIPRRTNGAGFVGKFGRKEFKSLKRKVGKRNLRIIEARFRNESRNYVFFLEKFSIISLVFFRFLENWY
jgi:hypothetical protein